MSTSFPYSAVNPYDLFFSVLRHRDEGKENQFHFVEMSEREGSFSMTDRIDERRMCERLLRITGNKSETFVVVNGVGGGLGHKYRSTEMEVTYALIARKRLYCVCQ